MFLLTIGNSYLSYGQYITTYTIFCIIIIRIYETTIFSGGKSTNLNIFEQIYLFTAFINIEYFLEKSQSAMCFLSKSYYIKHGKTNKNKLINKRLFYSQWSLLRKDMLPIIYYYLELWIGSVSNKAWRKSTWFLLMGYAYTCSIL